MAAAGHDLRQPLQTISTSLELAKHKTIQPDVVVIADCGLVAVKNGAELDELTHASIAAIDSIGPRRQVVRASDVLDEMECTWRPVAERKDLALRFTSTRLRVVTDPKLLRTILGNVIGNAVKYTERGEVLVSCRRRGAEVGFKVLGTGIGIPPARINEMFIPFHKGDTQTAGLGLGLSIVRATSDLLGHRLHLDSVPGRGTTFRVKLPRAD